MTPEKFTSIHFDCLIIGGGTAGLTLAARLTEDEDVTVGVLEAGRDHGEDYIVDTPGMFSASFGQDKYDWQFPTVPQVTSFPLVSSRCNC